MKSNTANIQDLICSHPKVSIGMPVYNGEKYIKQAVDSILNQTFSDFELIISDNASTDKTKEICSNYALKDKRVRYYRNKKNIGAPGNYNRVFKLSRGEYFKWAAYDDVLAPQYLEKCINILKNDPSIFGCHSKTGKIDQNGVFIGYYNEGSLKNICSKKTHERFRDLIDFYYTTTPFHAVYRSKKFAKSQLHGSYVGADRNLVAELSLMGRIYEIPECLFYWRDHPDSYTSRFYGIKRQDTLDRLIDEATWWSAERKSFFPHCRNSYEYFKSVNRVGLRFSERILCYWQITDWLLKEGNRFIIKDLVLFPLQHSKTSSKIIRKIPAKIRYRFLP